VRACKSGEAGAIHLWAARWIETLARLSSSTIEAESSARAEHTVDLLVEFARRKLVDSKPAKCRLTDAQFIIARSHGFESWNRFSAHVGAMVAANSSVTRFEQAADAIVAGDTEALERLLGESPVLIRARSTREHRATLLHYVAANGVENFRQKTPPNIVQVAEILLSHGSAVDAEADVYGGGATTLELVSTSAHPERAGVQKELIQILLEHGAALDHTGSAGHRHSLVAACLANGRGRAAEYLAERGAPLDLEGAAGVGRLDVVQSLLAPDGGLITTLPKTQIERGFLWACEYGRNDVIEFLLRCGVDLHTVADTGQTGLHWAVIGAQTDTIKLLVARGAALEAKNAYGGTALGQALWSAVNGDAGIDYLPAIAALLDSGAKIDEGSLAWLAGQSEGSALTKQRVTEELRRHGATT